MPAKIVQLSDAPGADDDPIGRRQAIADADIAIDAEGVIFKNRYGAENVDATPAQLMQAVRI